MGAGTLIHPGRGPARGFLFEPHPRAYALPADPGPGIQLRRGNTASRHPGKRWRFPKRPRAYVAYGNGGGSFPGVGALGASTFLLSLQPGTKVTYGWSTDVITSYSGREQRQSAYGQPRQRYEGVAFLLDGADRDVRGAMMAGAASGATFTLALSYEELSLSADASGTILQVGSTEGVDWLVVGQRVAVVSPAGVTAAAVVQSFTATTITLDIYPGALGVAGGAVMPLMQVLLEPQQGFARYPTRVDLWSLRARSAAFGWAGVDAMGVDAMVTTMSAGSRAAIDDVLDGDLLIWDRSNDSDGTVNESMLSGAEVVDLGALPFGTGARTVPDWGRTLKFRATSRADWQAWKAFIRRARGRQGAFLLSTNHDDLVYVATVTGGITVVSSSVAGGGDYARWFVSEAHRRLAITASGVTRYFHVTAVADNGNGTLTLTTDFAVTGTVTKISVLEQVRFERDELEATWDGAAFVIEETVRAVQEVFTVPSRYLFETVISASYQRNGIFTHQLLAEPLGINTAINFIIVNSAGFPSSGDFGGITATGGNADGMVVLITAPTGGTIEMHHEDTLFTASSRIRNPGLSQLSTGVSGALLYRYNGTIERWTPIGQG